jgi:hypothetical protein
MKRFATMVALGLVLAVGAGSAQAAKPAKGDKEARKAARQEKRGGAAMGVVLKVGENQITLQGRGKQAAETVVTVDGNTKYEGVASLADIKPGMRVMVTPGTGTAQKIVVHEGKGAGAGKGAKKLKNK